jgi:hypothetical protein
MLLQIILIFYIQFILHRIHLNSQIALTRNKVTIFGNFSGTLSDVVPVELWENSYKSVHFLLTEIRNNQRITV